MLKFEETRLCSLIRLSISNVFFLIFPDKNHWFASARSELKSALNLNLITNHARSAILFVGDGMGPNTVTASRILRYGEGGLLSFEKFPHIGLLKVIATKINIYIAKL